MAVLEAEIGRLGADQLAGMRDNLNMLFHECVAHLSHSHQAGFGPVCTACYYARCEIMVIDNITVNQN